MANQIINRNAVVANMARDVRTGMAATALRLKMFVGRFPRVARASQPWALGRNPVGILGWREGLRVLHLVATGEKFVPITTKYSPQTDQRWQAGKVFAGFDVLNVAGAHANLFSQFLLGQIPTRPQ